MGAFKFYVTSIYQLLKSNLDLLVLRLCEINFNISKFLYAHFEFMFKTVLSTDC